MRPAKITKQCFSCGADFQIPPSRDWREHCCSSACKATRAAQVFADAVFERSRNCAACGAFFIPRKTQVDAGVGKFCSKECGISCNQHLLHADHVKKSRVVGIRRSIAEGRTVRRRGSDSPYWTGGAEASKARAKPKMAAKLREYRKRNPAKVREWSQKRSSAKTGRLPRGTVAKLLKLQREKCAICKCSLKAGYHVDHINPLARGGAHAALNIQLLCPPCNVRKSAKDPIEFMQSRGFLI